MREIDFIQQVLCDMAELVREKYAIRNEIAVSSKRHPNDLLTEADLAVQDAVVGRIREVFPTDAIAAEERGLNDMPVEPDRRCWVIDPIDGTQNFVRGIFPVFGVSIGFARGGRPVAGGVILPITGDLFLAEKGGGVTRNGRPTQVSAEPHALTARVEVDFSGPPERVATLRRAGRIICECGQIRCNCSTVFSLVSIASGDMDGFFHVALYPWDYAAGVVIVEEAGGKVSRLDGSEVRLFDGKRGMVASNGLIHEELLALVEA